MFRISASRRRGPRFRLRKKDEEERTLIEGAGQSGILFGGIWRGRVGRVLGLAYVFVVRFWISVLLEILFLQWSSDFCQQAVFSP